MSSRLSQVAVGGLVSAAAFLSIGTVLSGSGWANPSYLWQGNSTCGPLSGETQQVTLPFAAGDRLRINLTGSVHYIPGEKAEAIVKGDSGVVSHVRMSSGELSLDCASSWSTPKFDVTISGPPIEKWDLTGSGDLTLSQLQQPKLEITIKGSGSSVATGTVQTLDLSISGSGSARFGDLTAQSASVAIRGSGDAQITAKTDADVSIYGSGNVELSGRPEIRRADIKGSGRIVQVP